MMNEQGKSDGAVVPAKSPNKAGKQPAAEGMEGSALAKGNSSEQNTAGYKAGKGCKTRWDGYVKLQS